MIFVRDISVLSFYSLSLSFSFPLYLSLSPSLSPSGRFIVAGMSCKVGLWLAFRFPAFKTFLLVNFFLSSTLVSWQGQH